MGMRVRACVSLYIPAYEFAVFIFTCISPAFDSKTNKPYI